MGIVAGRIVKTPTEPQPYKVILEYDGAQTLEYPVASVREGETLIREKTPPLSKAETMVRGMAVPGLRNRWRGKINLLREDR